MTLEPRCVRAGVVLLGSGARGVPVLDAAHVAADAVCTWREPETVPEAATDHVHGVREVCFGLVDEVSLDALADSMDDAMRNNKHDRQG